MPRSEDELTLAQVMLPEDANPRGNVHGGTLMKLADTAGSHEIFEGLKNIQGLTEKLSPLDIKPKEKTEVLVSAAEFVLEGLHAHRRIGRTEERVFSAEKQAKRVEKQPFEYEDQPPVRNRRPYN